MHTARRIRRTAIANYKHGRDEDTAVAAQVWTIGLSAHF
jgi:hypothetical protein